MLGRGGGGGLGRKETNIGFPLYLSIQTLTRVCDLEFNHVTLGCDLGNVCLKWLYLTLTLIIWHWPCQGKRPRVGCCYCWCFRGPHPLQTLIIVILIRLLCCLYLTDSHADCFSQLGSGQSCKKKCFDKSVKMKWSWTGQTRVKKRGVSKPDLLRKCEY